MHVRSDRQPCLNNLMLLRFHPVSRRIAHSNGPYFQRCFQIHDMVTAIAKNEAPLVIAADND